MNAQGAAPRAGGLEDSGKVEGNDCSIAPRKLRGDHCLCKACGLYFNSTAAFDKHRTGPHGWGTRRCRTVVEMLTAGMALNAGGWWVSRPNARRCPPCDARSCYRVAAHI